MSEYDTVIVRYDKKVRDYALHVCKRLFSRNQCTTVCFNDIQDNLVWLGIKAFAHMSNPEEQSVYLCNHCKPKVKGNDMPARCALNGLDTVPQLIQLAKTLTRLKTYRAGGSNLTVVRPFPKRGVRGSSPRNIWKNAACWCILVLFKGYLINNHNHEDGDIYG